MQTARCSRSPDRTIRLLITSPDLVRTGENVLARCLKVNQAFNAHDPRFLSMPNNEFGWRCPQPLADPATNPENAWNLDNGTPPGHAWCGYCDELHAVGSPSTSRCSICTTSFCGLSVPALCAAHHLSSAQLPVAVSNLTGIIQSQEVYEAFYGNTTEVIAYFQILSRATIHLYYWFASQVEILFDWLREDGRGPRGMLLDVRASCFTRYLNSR